MTDEKVPTLDEYVRGEGGGKTVNEIFAERDRRDAMRCTVAQLVEKLQGLNTPDALVELEGCDCTGYASGEVFVRSDGTVLIERAS